MPQGHDGLLKIASNLLNYDEAETAPKDVHVTPTSLVSNEYDSLTVCSDTVSIGSGTSQPIRTFLVLILILKHGMYNMK